MRRVLVGRKIVQASAQPDALIFKGAGQQEIEAALMENTVEAVSRKGKYFWWSLSNGRSLIGHLGMSGWIHEGAPESPVPPFAKLVVSVERGSSISFTDPRRLGRIWMSGDPMEDPAIKKLGLDAFTSLPNKLDFESMIRARRAPIKGVLLDQTVLSGIGNYLADEMLYQARISPKRGANELTPGECSKLRKSIQEVLEVAVVAEADETRFPGDWMFHHRWGGGRGPEKIGKHLIVRETVAGRTTAWVPKVQK